jgi:hypothetical protein
MCSGGQDREAMLGRGGGCGLPQPKQIGANFRRIRVRHRRNLDLRLQEFPCNTAAGLVPCRLKEAVGRLCRDLQAFGVGQEVFLFDAEAEIVVAGEGLLAETSPAV